MSAESDSLLDILRGASYHTFGKGISYLAGAILNVALARFFGANAYGFFVYARSLTSIGFTFADLGSRPAILRYLPRERDSAKRAGAALSLSIASSTIGSVVVAAILFSAAPTISHLTLNDPLFVETLRTFVFVLPFRSFVRLLSSSFRALEMIDFAVLSREIIEPISRLIAILVALYLGYSVVGSARAVVISTALALLLTLTLFIIKSDIRPRVPPSGQYAREYAKFSLPLTLSNAGALLYNRADVLLVGFFFSASAVAVYNVSILVTSFLTLPLIAFDRLFTPLASRLYDQQKNEELNSVFSTITRWTITLTLFGFLWIVVFRTQIFSIFGKDFTRTDILVLFAFAQLVNTAVGPSNNLLMMTDHQYLSMMNHWILGILNIILNYVFLMIFGIIGAAVATALVLATINIVRLIEVWSFERLFPYNTSFLKPIAAGVLVTPIFYLSRMYISGLLSPILGGFLGACFYFVILFLFGVEERDQELIRRIRS